MLVEEKRERKREGVGIVQGRDVKNTQEGKKEKEKEMYQMRPKRTHACTTIILSFRLLEYVIFFSACFDKTTSYILSFFLPILPHTIPQLLSIAPSTRLMAVAPLKGKSDTEIISSM
jgi:hypothetical protein